MTRLVPLLSPTKETLGLLSCPEEWPGPTRKVKNRQSAEWANLKFKCLTIPNTKNLFYVYPDNKSM